jgi:hypothetical protein
MILLLSASLAWAGPLQVETVQIEAGCRFNQGRPYLLSLDQELDRGRLRKELRRRLVRAEELVVDRFEVEARPQRVELVLGRDLPLELAQAILASALEAGIPGLVLSQAEREGPLCARSQAVLGSIQPTAAEPIDPEGLRALLALGEAEFWARIPPSGR